MSLQAESSVVLNTFLEIRRLISEELPVENNMITLDIVMLILYEHYAGRGLQVKSLFSSLPHSKTGIRYGCKKLFEDGWIDKTESGIDGRVKLLVPTEKLLQSYSAFSSKLMLLYKQD